MRVWEMEELDPAGQRPHQHHQRSNQPMYGGKVSFLIIFIYLNCFFLQKKIKMKPTYKTHEKH